MGEADRHAGEATVLGLGELLVHSRDLFLAGFISKVWFYEELGDSLKSLLESFTRDLEVEVRVSQACGCVVITSVVRDEL